MNRTSLHGGSFKIALLIPLMFAGGSLVSVKHNSWKPGTGSSSYRSRTSSYGYITSCQVHKIINTKTRFEIYF